MVPDGFPDDEDERDDGEDLAGEARRVVAIEWEKIHN